MDRLEEWRTFVAVEKPAQLRRGAARRLQRSPQAVTRAIAALEARIGVAPVQPHHALGVADQRRRALSGTQPARPGGVRSAGGPARCPRRAAGAAGGDGVGAVRPAASAARGGRVSRPASPARRAPAAARSGGLAGRGGHRPRRAHRRAARFVAARAAGRPRALGGLRQPSLPGPRGSTANARGAGETRLHRFHRHDPDPEPLVVPDRQAARAQHRRAPATDREHRPGRHRRGPWRGWAWCGCSRTRSASCWPTSSCASCWARFEPAPLPVHIVHLPGVQPRAAAAFVEFATERLRKRIA